MLFNHLSAIYPDDKFMEPFLNLISRVVPLPVEDIDTDQIIPARYLKVTGKDGLADGLFAGWRYLPDGNPDPSFPLNRPEFQGAQILLAGDNFGCGSSREHAPWALVGWGIRAVISSSFADIFRNNALKNGLLPVMVEQVELQALFAYLQSNPTSQIEIDLAQQTLCYADNRRMHFPIEAFNKTCLLEGLDQLGYLLRFTKQIEDYERAIGAVR